MPQVTVYVREEDLPKWKALEKKSEFLHHALNGNVHSVSTTPSPNRPFPEKPSIEQPFIPKPPDPETGYPCCLNERKPCKHWLFDGDDQVWVNSLTGKTREVL